MNLEFDYVSMEQKKYYNNQNTPFKRIVYVTAFLDIQRHMWENEQLKRDPTYYIDAFRHLMNLKPNIVAFIDDRYIHLFDNYLSTSNPYVQLIPINIDWLMKYSDSWKKNSISEKIMRSEGYREKFKHNIEIHKVPGNIYSEYNAINHSKIDLIKYAIEQQLVQDTDWICWCDFGYYKSVLHFNSLEYPHSNLDLNKFNFDKLNVCLCHKINTLDYDDDYYLTNMTMRITGSFWAGSSKTMLEFHTLYHQCLDEMYRKQLSYEDQYVHLQCFFRYPNLFELFLTPPNCIWPQALTYFQMDFHNRFEYIDYHLRTIRNGIFVEVGVCHGSLTEHILKTHTSCQLYCIDPYISYKEYEDAAANVIGDAVYESVRGRICSQFGERAQFIRKFSSEAIHDVPDNLDFVYIDANHKYQYVLEDLELWYPKLKYGGYIILDDALDMDDSLRDSEGNVFICFGEQSYAKFGVFQACKIFTKKYNIPFYKWETQIILFKPLFLKPIENQSTVVGFLTNKLTLRGTEVALYDYADYNEKLLGNKSIILTRDYYSIQDEMDVDALAYRKFLSRFNVVYYKTQEDIDRIVQQYHISHLFIEKAGYWDELSSKYCKNIIHCVFSTEQPHGDVYTPLGETINQNFKTRFPVTPYMVTLPDIDEDLRYILQIPQHAIVFGRYGGKESFDIPFVHDIVQNILNTREDVYFLFLNTNSFYNHPRIIYLPGTEDMIFKRKFINTCDALIHARYRGETFGLTCGEFSICKKPVITWGGSNEREHLIILGEKAVVYHNSSDLYSILYSFTRNLYNVNQNGYQKYTPEYVMNVFKENCLKP